jgi:hypothetical protein
MGMGTTRRAAAIVGVITALAGISVQAHHSWTAVFDEDKPIIVTGTLTKVEFVNPHGWIWIDVKNADGSISSYGVEGGAPNGLIRNGVTKNSMKLGETLTVRGYGSRDGSNLIAGVSYTKADGSQFFLGNEGAENAAKAKGNLK